MASYIYIPIMTGEMAAMATDWNNGRTRLGKAPYQILGADSSGIGKALRRQFGGGYLSNVTAADKVYILAHGVKAQLNDGALSIGVQRGAQYVPDGNSLTGYSAQGGAWKYYSAIELARHLEKEGLPKTFVDLRLFCCSAGLTATFQGNPVAPYAQRLKAALTARGYNAIVVTGYRGDLNCQYNHYCAPGTIVAMGSAIQGRGKGVKLPGDTYCSRAKNGRVQF
ncbi:MAG: hypothetical protein JO015_13215 [Verrucomicrobia bacterium]|nr:hypothetical protein [Verrucomicrobiota bacterium]